MLLTHRSQQYHVVTAYKHIYETPEHRLYIAIWLQCTTKKLHIATHSFYCGHKSSVGDIKFHLFFWFTLEKHLKWFHGSYNSLNCTAVVVPAIPITRTDAQMLMCNTHIYCICIFISQRTTENKKSLHITVASVVHK